MIRTEDLKAVAQAYAGRDDWGVENVSLRTLDHLMAQLAAGVPVELIVDHARHTGRACCGLSRYDADGVS